MVTPLYNYGDAIARARWRLGNLKVGTFIKVGTMDTTMGRKNLKIDESTKERLYAHKKYGETYDDTLHRLMDAYEREEEDA